MGQVFQQSGCLKEVRNSSKNGLAELFFYHSLRLVPEGAECFQQIFQGVLKGLMKIDMLSSAPEN